jgi:hypothetical protein
VSIEKRLPHTLHSFRIQHASEWSLAPTEKRRLYVAAQFIPEPVFEREGETTLGPTDNLLR